MKENNFLVVWMCICALCEVTDADRKKKKKEREK